MGRFSRITKCNMKNKEELTPVLQKILDMPKYGQLTDEDVEKARYTYFKEKYDVDGDLDIADSDSMLSDDDGIALSLDKDSYTPEELREMLINDVKESASARAGWAAAAKQAHADGEDKLIAADVFEDETGSQEARCEVPKKREQPPVR